MKKILSFILLGLLLLTLAACQQPVEPDNVGDSQISVVTTIFAPYDFVRQVAGEHAEITMLLPPAAESHSYEPTPQDIIKIQNCDAFIYVGGDSDAWVHEVLESIDTSKMKIITLMDCVETVEEALVEGMEENHSHETATFEDAQVQDRTLDDWQGDWQSVYPYLLDGTLDEVMLHKAEESEDGKTAEEYHDYYEIGYQTDVERIVIEGDTFTFYKNGVPTSASYDYKGYQILTYESGNKGVRYFFETSEDTGAPRYIQFSDHLIEPTKADHFHLYWGDESFDALLEEMDNWPTYYPSNLSATEIADEMLGHEEEHELDEHVWTSPRNAKLIVQKISDALCAIDEVNASAYQKNTVSYLDKLDQLDTQFQALVDSAARNTLVFGDRFPFRYLADAYGLEYFAAFPGCSTETEASAATIAFLIDKVKAEGIPVVFHVELSNQKMANTISEATGAKVLLLHACHNVSKTDFDSGIGYLELMEQNLLHLKEALQ